MVTRQHIRDRHHETITDGMCDWKERKESNMTLKFNFG